LTVLPAGFQPLPPPAWVRRLPAAVQRALDGPAHPLHRILPRLERAADRLELGATERVIVACLLAQDIDEDIHDRVMGERAARACTRSDLVHVAGGDAVDVLEALVALEERGIVRAADDGERPWAAVPVVLAPALWGEALRDREGDGPAARPPLLPRIARAIDEIVDACRRLTARELHVIVRGRRGSGRDAVLAALARQLATAAYTRTPLELRGDGDTLEPELSGRAAVWDGRNLAVHPDDLARAAGFLARSTTVCVSLLDPDDDAPVVSGRVAFAIDTDARDAAERTAGWEQALAPRIAAPLRARVAAALAARSRAGAGLAHHVAAAVGEPAEATTAAWSRALVHQLESALQPGQLRGVTVEHPAVSRDVIVVAEPTADRIAQLLAMMRHAAELATPTRLGVKALLSGPSGTGKTLTARCLAAELDRPLFRVDLATVVSKWVGETEKNLRRAMYAAEAAGAVLLFDEGDALFGTRGEIARGSDRYANMEVSYLLQALELFDGLVVVTTNLRGNVDRAFLRRFDITIDFHKPDARLRGTLWRQELGPDAAALSDGLLDRVATQTDLAGGHIAVVCRAARALALTRASPLSDADLIRALTAELRSTGSNVAASRWTAPPD